MYNLVNPLINLGRSNSFQYSNISRVFLINGLNEGPDLTGNSRRHEFLLVLLHCDQQKLRTVFSAVVLSILSSNGKGRLEVNIQWEIMGDQRLLSNEGGDFISLANDNGEQYSVQHHCDVFKPMKLQILFFSMFLMVNK